MYIINPKVEILIAKFVNLCTRGYLQKKKRKTSEIINLLSAQTADKNAKNKQRIQEKLFVEAEIAYENLRIEFFFVVKRNEKGLLRHSAICRHILELMLVKCVYLVERSSAELQGKYLDELAWIASMLFPPDPGPPGTRITQHTKRCAVFLFDKGRKNRTHR